MVKLNLPKEIAKALVDDRAFIKALFERPPSLSALLPYDEFMEDGSVWRNHDGSLGMVFDATLLEHEPMSAEQIVGQVKSLSSWLTLPPDCALQVLFDQSRISSGDKVFAELGATFPDGHAVSKMLFDERLRRLHDSARGETSDGPLRRRLIIALRHFPQRGRRVTAREAFGRGEETLLGETQAFVRALKAFRGLCADFVSGSKIPLRPMHASEVLEVLRQFFNPRTYYERPFAAWNPAVPFSEQILYNSPVLDHAGIEREGVKTRTISLKTSPQVAYPGGMAYFTKLSFPFRLALSFSFPPSAKIKQFFDMKEFFLQNTPSARSRRQREEVLTVQEQLAHDNRCLHMTFNVIIEGKNDEELDGRTREILGIFQNDLGCEAIVEDMIGLGLCLNALPLTYTPKADHSSRRFIRILRSDAVNFLPVFDSFRGLGQPLQLYLSRERNIVKFSLNENETSNHTVVVADTGSGKSAFVIDCIQAAKRVSPEPLVFVIDKKSSYLMLSRYYDADLTQFDRGGEVPFSPFRGEFDDEKVAFLTNLIASGVNLTSQRFAVESEHLTALTKALRLAHAKKLRQAGLTYADGELRTVEGASGGVYVSMDDVVAELAAIPGLPGFERYAVAIEALIPKLAPFYGDGLYAKFFRGSGDAMPARSKLFFIYDLDALDNDPTLQALMTMAVVEEIRQTIRLPENRGRGGFVVLEELGMIGRHNPYASQFIKDAAETFRKLGVWLIALTPRPQNYFETEAGKAMWGVADNIIMMQMSEDNIRYLEEHSALVDPTNRGIVKSLRTVRGKYADVYYMNKSRTREGVFRFIQTSLDRWLAPTNAKDAAAVERAQRRHKDDKWAALAELAASD